MDSESVPNSDLVRPITAWLKPQVTRFAILATIVITAVTIVSFAARLWWLADILANLRMQWLIALIILVLTSAGLKQWKLLFIQILAATVNLCFVGFPIGVETPSTGKGLLTVTSANVYTGNRRHDDIRDALTEHTPDIIAVLELSSELSRHLDAELRLTHPHQIVKPQDRGNFGIGLYSRHPFASAEFHEFGSVGIPSIVARIRVEASDINIIATHPMPPIGPNAFRSRNLHLQKLAAHVQGLLDAKPEASVIVMGDLNLTPWSPIFDDFQTSAGLASTARDQRFTPTWYRFDAFPFGLALDHILTTNDLQPKNYTVGADVGSDHRFVTVELMKAQPED